MSEREPGNGPGERPGRDPVNHHPPEEWRPGDRGDPIEGGPRPPGEPPHGAPPGAPGDLSAYGGAAPEPERSSERPSTGEGPSPEGTTAGSTAAGGTPNDRPFGGGELSEGPSGPGEAGAENTGYAPGYGDYPSGPVHYGGPGGYAGSGGYGGPGHAPDAAPAPSPTLWGKILGIGCGVLLLLLLIVGGFATVMFFMAGTEASASVGPMYTPIE